MADLADAIRALRTLGDLANYRLPAADEELLTRDWDDLAPRERERIKPLITAAANGFMHAAARGITFTDPTSIKARFGSSLEDNYSEGGRAFLKFAYAYWTLKQVIDDAYEEGPQPTAISILELIERLIGPLFFPAFGPVLIDPRIRETDQRKFLMASGVAFDVDDFISNNPILIRDRSRSGTGCLKVIILAIGVTAYETLRWFVT